MGKNRKNKTYYINLKLIGIISILFAMVFSLSINTYARYTIRGTLSGVAIVPARDGKLEIIEIVYDTSTNANQNDSNNTYSETTMDSSITLGPTAPSSITYTVTIKNNTDTPQEYDDVIINTFDNNDIEFTYSGIQNGDILGPGEEINVSVTFKYKNTVTNVTNQDLTSSITFKFEEADVAAKIGNKYYKTLQLALNDVPTTDVATTVELLKDVKENIEVAVDQNVIFDLANHTITNNTNTNTLRVYGKATISNGTIKCSAGSGAVNAEANSVLNITGGRIEATGSRQALYNSGGTVNISGNPYLSSTTNQRATVQNDTGTMTITGGTFTSTGQSALLNNATLTIGVKDGDPNKSNPVFIGETIGITANNNKYYKFYNGIAKGKTNGINNINLINDIEDDYSIVTPPERVENQVYKTAYLGTPVIVTFNGNGGTSEEPTRTANLNSPITVLPNATRSGYIFDGWYTDPVDGDEVIEDETIVSHDITYYAHWETEGDVIQIDNDKYDTFAEALNTIPLNTPTTITLLKNVKEKVEIPANMDITIDLNGKTISNNGDTFIFENRGSLTVIGGGTITSNSVSHGAINNEVGTMIIENINITTTGGRQGLYAKGGHVEIRDGTYINTYASGITDNTLPRSSVQCMASCTMLITGGTIINNAQQAVTNSGTLTIGNKDGNVNITKPILQGETDGLYNKGTFNFYDGTIKGIDDAINGTITDQETTIVSGTEIINNKTYLTNYNN